ncbi:MAG: hypothetical protein ABGX16_05800 [Pirellulales bacterium]
MNSDIRPAIFYRGPNARLEAPRRSKMTAAKTTGVCLRIPTETATDGIQLVCPASYER